VLSNKAALASARGCSCSIGEKSPFIKAACTIWLALKRWQPEATVCHKRLPIPTHLAQSAPCKRMKSLFQPAIAQQKCNSFSGRACRQPRSSKKLLY